MTPPGFDAGGGQLFNDSNAANNKLVNLQLADSSPVHKEPTDRQCPDRQGTEGRGANKGEPNAAVPMACAPVAAAGKVRLVCGASTCIDRRSKATSASRPVAVNWRFPGQRIELRDVALEQRTGSIISDIMSEATDADGQDLGSLRQCSRKRCSPVPRASLDSLPRTASKPGVCRKLRPLPGEIAMTQDDPKAQRARDAFMTRFTASIMREMRARPSGVRLPELASALGSKVEVVRRKLKVAKALQMVETRIPEELAPTEWVLLSEGLEALCSFDRDNPQDVFIAESVRPSPRALGPNSVFALGQSDARACEPDSVRDKE